MDDANNRRIEISTTISRQYRPYLRSSCEDQKKDLRAKLIAETQIDKIECAGELHVQVMKARYLKTGGGGNGTCNITADVTATIAAYCSKQNGHDCILQPKNALMLPTLIDSCPGGEKQLQIDYQCSPITSLSAEMEARASRLVCNDYIYILIHHYLYMRLYAYAY